MERIYVAVRARPLSPEESESNPWVISGNSIFLPNQPSKFEFDRVFAEDCKTVDIFESRIKEIVASVVSGFNGTIFAYGQTSSGKTYTMRGSAKEPGIIPLSVHELFCSIQEKMDREFLLRMSYMEIYNEEINDLLAPEHRKLQIHESLERGIYVAGLKEEIVNSPEQVLKLVEFGESYRHIGETNMNLYSSRSHTIFRMIVESRERSTGGHSFDCFDAVRVSALNLVDLAGSERAGKTGAEGMRLKEGSHINKSLMALGTVIKKLSDGVESLGGHVPYRDSKLTRILQPALGGNANTAMICNITLSQIHADETKSTLQFASKALQVKNCACVNEILTDAALLKRQKKEIEELRTKLLSSHSEHLEEEILNLRNTLLQSELEKERIALELEVEKKAKAHHERRLLEQAKKIENLSSLILCSERDDRNIHSMKEKRRLTWCPGPFLKKSSDVLSNAEDNIIGPVEEQLATSVLHPLFKPVQGSEDHGDSNRFRSCSSDIAHSTEESFSFPDAHLLLNVTSRRKNHRRKVALHLENGQSVEKIPEFADLYIGTEAKIDSLEVKKTAMQLSLNDDIAFRTENDHLKQKYEEEQALLHDTEKDELLSRVVCLQKEVSWLSSSSLALENEALKKDLDECNSKLMNTGYKLKNIIQDNIRLEDDYEKLQFTSFQMEADISSLKEALETTICEKEEVSIKNIILSSELEAMTNKLNTAYVEIKLLKEEHVKLEKGMIDLKSSCRVLKDSLDSVLREKEEMMLQFTEALLEVEAEKSEWPPKERTFNKKLNTSNNVVQLSENLSDGNSKNIENDELRKELSSTKEKLDAYRRRLKEALDERKVMDIKYKKASSKLKDQLRSYGHHILHLTKQLSEQI